MKVSIQNCNNIDSGTIEIFENKLNIKYAINGTGKSTISKAICNFVFDKDSGSNNLSGLKPFKAIEDEEIMPNVDGCEAIKSIKVFDEKYVDEFVFQPGELLKGSFDILIRDDRYESSMREIDELVSQIKSHFVNDPEIDALINDFNKLSQCFGKSTKTGTIHGSSTVAKALKGGNNVTNIPIGLETYKEYIQGKDNVRWVKWQIDGNQFIEQSNNCPYCVGDVTEKKEIIKKVSQNYDARRIENIREIIEVFQRLNKYFSDDTNAIINDFIESINGYNDDQAGYLNGVKNQVELLSLKLTQLKNIGFDSFKDVDKVINQLNSYLIDPKLYKHLQSEETLSTIKQFNESIEELIQKAGVLQGKINHQKKHIEDLVCEHKTGINSFLKNAGYKYEVDLKEGNNGQHKLILIHLDHINSVLSEVRNTLSYGERNAFALVLFMFDALKSQSDLIILDDPISSFDQNKKFAIIEMLFRGNRCFRGKTVLLLSHDFEPILDMVYHHQDRFEKPHAYFLENKHGNLDEILVEKSDVQTFIDINKKNALDSLKDIVVRLVYLRRTCEILENKPLAFQLLSNVFHKRSVPEFREYDSDRNIIVRNMSNEELSSASDEIKEIIPDFNYYDVITQVTDDAKMKSLYGTCRNNYEKLHIYRIIYDDKLNGNHVATIQKFINQAFHIETDYIYQLNPAKYQTVPQYVIDECDKIIAVN